MRGAPAAIVPFVVGWALAYAGPGDLDPTFAGGRVVTLAAGANTIGGRVASLPDGGVAVVAAASDPLGIFEHDRSRVVVARLRADGELDPAFGGGGLAYHVFESETEPPRSDARLIASQPDGRLVIAGVASGRYVDTRRRVGVMRLLPTGALDPSFGVGGVVLWETPHETPVDLLIDPAGRIVLGSDVFVDGRLRFAVRRLDPTGAPDPTFGRDGLFVATVEAGVSHQLAAVVRAADGTLTAVGVAFEDSDTTVTRTVAVRVDAAGRPDPGFGTDGAVVLANGEWPIAAALDTHGRLVIATSGYRALRLLPSGGVDQSFAMAGMTRRLFPVPQAHATRIVLDCEGRVLIGGFVETDPSQPQYSFALARLTADGRLDRDFGDRGRVLTPIERTAALFGLALQPGARVVTGGFADRRPPGIGRVVAVARYDTGVACDTGCALAAGRVRLRRPGAPVEQPLSVTAKVPLAATAPLPDPVTSGAHLTLAAADGTVLANVVAPAGAYDPRVRAGWRVWGSAWSFLDPTGRSGIRSLRIRHLGARLGVRARLRQTFDPAPAARPPTARIELPGTACGVLAFPPEPDDGESRIQSVGRVLR